MQSFDEKGLKFLTRTHDKSTAIEAIKLSKQYFDNVNVDLIYGWPTQTDESWKNDLEIIADLKPHHMSLYNLTYEPATVIGRRQQRGLIKGPNDDTLSSYYDIASKKLGQLGYLHEEISNWHLEGKEAFHNNLYWTDENYIGIGLGAHGYISDISKFGLRYSFSKSWNGF